MGGQRVAPAASVFYSLGSVGCYGVRTDTHSLLVAESHSRGPGISDQKSEGGVLGEKVGGGVTLALCAQVVGFDMSPPIWGADGCDAGVGECV